jgi:hypothetical protein
MKQKERSAHDVPSLNAILPIPSYERFNRQPVGMSDSVIQTCFLRYS